MESTNYGKLKVIFFQGPPSSGKDSVCDWLVENYPGKFHKISAKTQLFLDTFTIFDVDSEWFHAGYTEVEKNVPEEKLKGMSRRQALIHTSEQIMKPTYGQDYYGKAMLNHIHPEKINVVSDSGFPEEINALADELKLEETILVRLSRVGKSFVDSGDSRRYCRVSDNYEKFPSIGFSMTSILDDDNEYIEPVDRMQEWFDQGRECVRVRSMTLYNNSTLDDFHQDIKKLVGSYI